MQLVFPQYHILTYLCAYLTAVSFILSGVQSHHVQPAMATNPFMNTAATGAGYTFSPPGTALSSPFVPMSAGPSSSYLANIHSPYFGASPQSAGAAWSGNSSMFSFGGQQFPPTAAASNPFLVSLFFQIISCKGRLKCRQHFMFLRSFKHFFCSDGVDGRLCRNIEVHCWFSLKFGL